MLNLETMEMDDFSPEYYSRNQIPIAFDENAVCPRFLNELLAPALDDEDIEVIQKYFGMCLLGYNYSQQLLILERTPGDGKSTLVDVLRQIIGRRNIAELRTNLLNERFEMAAFGGKTLLIGYDVPGNFLQRSGAEVLKKLTGRDCISVSHVRELITCFTPQERRNSALRSRSSAVGEGTSGIVSGCPTA